MGGMEPASVANQSLDAIGRGFDSIGDLEEGTFAAQVMLRAYDQCLRQLLRAALWNFARRQAPLTLLADASGNTPDVGTTVLLGWMYEYAVPTDCLRSRFVPWNYANPATVIPADNIQIPDTPLVTGVRTQPVPLRPQPALFIESLDYNYPPATPGDYETPGVSPIGRTVICTNVRDAQLVYTSYMPYPSVWDPNFRAAMVAYLASEIALPLWTKEDRKFGMQMREANIAIVRSKVIEARVADGNDGGPRTSSIRVDWMDGRNSGGFSNGMWSLGGRGLGGGPDGGVYGYGWDSLPLAGGAVF